MCTLVQWSEVGTLKFIPFTETLTKLKGRIAAIRVESHAAMVGYSYSIEIVIPINPHKKGIQTEDDMEIWYPVCTIPVVGNTYTTDKILAQNIAREIAERFGIFYAELGCHFYVFKHDIAVIKEHLNKE